MQKQFIEYFVFAIYFQGGTSKCPRQKIPFRRQNVEFLITMHLPPGYTKKVIKRKQDYKVNLIPLGGSNYLDFEVKTVFL